MNNTGNKDNKIVIGIDLGDAKNGLALGHLQTKTAVGLKTIKSEFLKAELEKIIADNNVDCLVIGMPYNLAGAVTQRTEKTMALVKELHEWFDIKIEIIDERWTTKQAKKTSPKGDDDQGAAILITQTYLDGLN